MKHTRDIPSSILARVIRPDQATLSPAAARSLLKLAFEAEDIVRVNDLAARAGKGDLSGEEEAELMEFRQIGLLIDLLKSKARLSLKRRGLTR